MPASARTSPADLGDADIYPRLIAFYLPQFHPIKENDEWWGEGFTEWTNVKRGKPNFVGHYQPFEPSELGMYDLRDPEVIERQAELARFYGIHGFCFYYYWFNGQRLLERPVDQFLSRGTPVFPFCICWANENWTRRWDGREDAILMKQDYSWDYAEKFIRDVIPILKDERYIRVKGAPLLLVYRASQLPDPRAAAHLWREVCRTEGIPAIHLAMIETSWTSPPHAYGFDAAVEFPCHIEVDFIRTETYPRVNPDFSGVLVDYVTLARKLLARRPRPFVHYRGVMPGWDNTPRRLNRSRIFVDASPDLYATWLARTVEQTISRSGVQEPLVFVNAWNEWGEGAYLEPDRREGRARLEATTRGICVGVVNHLRSQGLEVSAEEVAERMVQLGIVGDPAAVDPSPT